jgi:hypothetical protein
MGAREFGRYVALISDCFYHNLDPHYVILDHAEGPTLIPPDWPSWSLACAREPAPSSPMTTAVESAIKVFLVYIDIS